MSYEEQAVLFFSMTHHSYLIALPQSPCDAPSCSVGSKLMDLLHTFADLFLHLDTHLQTVTEQLGFWTYLLLFLIVLCETGLVVTPFLPGDSLLFATGAIAATGSLDMHLMLPLLMIAAILGDTINYSIGHALGPKVFRSHQSRFLNREYLDRTRLFYEAHGGKTIIIARFLPIIRTFAPFVAGIGRMQYSQFLLYNIVGGVLWVCLFLFGGYWFGRIPIVQENFEFVILGIIVVSVIPTVLEYIHHQRKARKARKAA